MKKILTILTVALLACSTVFAAVNLTGEFEEHRMERQKERLH